VSDSDNDCKADQEKGGKEGRAASPLDEDWLVHDGQQQQQQQQQPAACQGSHSAPVSPDALRFNASASHHRRRRRRTVLDEDDEQQQQQPAGQQGHEHAAAAGQQGHEHAAAVSQRGLQAIHEALPEEDEGDEEEIEMEEEGQQQRRHIETSKCEVARLHERVPAEAAAAAAAHQSQLGSSLQTLDPLMLVLQQEGLAVHTYRHDKVRRG
jgi:hypothetical protein